MIFLTVLTYFRLLMWIPNRIPCTIIKIFTVTFPDPHSTHFTRDRVSTVIGVQQLSYVRIRNPILTIGTISTDGYFRNFFPIKAFQYHVDLAVHGYSVHFQMLTRQKKWDFALRVVSSWWLFCQFIHCIIILTIRPRSYDQTVRYARPFSCI